MAIDATVGGTDADSYSTVAEADTYFGTDSRLGATAWSGETTAQQEAALKMATRRVDMERFEGIKLASGQALKWPRMHATDDDGEEYPTDVIPGIIQQATWEMALVYLIADDDGKVPQMDTGLEEFRRAKIGPMEIERDEGFRAGKLPDHVRRILSPALAGGGGLSVRMERS